MSKEKTSRRDIITAAVAEKYGLPICDKCHAPYIFDPCEPFASCLCHDSEWGHTGDPFRLMQVKLCQPPDAALFRVRMDWETVPDCAPICPSVTREDYRSQTAIGLFIVSFRAMVPSGRAGRQNSWTWCLLGHMEAVPCKSPEEGKQAAFEHLQKQLTKSLTPAV